MGFFHRTDILKAQAVLRTKSGIYRQVPLYQRDGCLYAQYDKGFVALLNSGSTSCPRVKWVYLRGVETVNGTAEDGFKLRVKS